MDEITVWALSSLKSLPDWLPASTTVFSPAFLGITWMAEKGTEIPKELIYRLTDNLFKDRETEDFPKHPSQDLADALVSASSGLNIKIPGLGELVIDRKGLRQFIKSSNQIRDVEQD